jgi:hypothetical protein
MPNYFNLEYESTSDPSPGSIELNYGSDYSNGLIVHVALFAGSGFTPTHYKMWGLIPVSGGDIVTYSGAEWVDYSATTYARLSRHNDPQKAYVKFKNSSETETETFESNEVTFTFIEPIIDNSVVWKVDFEQLNFDSATSNILVNSLNKVEIELNKENLDQLQFSGRNFKGLKVSEDAIYINPTSQIGQIIGLDNSSYVTITKKFNSSIVPLITVDYGDGFYTLSTYDQDIKTTVSGENSGRIGDINWDSVSKSLSFNAYKFSTYGFCTVQKVEFTNDSQTGAYVGGSATFRVYVQDSNGEPVENAPVTVIVESGDIGSIQESTPVNTNENGISVFNFNVTSVGQAIISANVDDSHFATKSLRINGVDNADWQRSLLTQYEQIYRTVTYDDNIDNVNTQSVSEPSSSTVSGTSDSVLEHDMNVLRTILKQIKGTDDWFSDIPKYFDPTNTDSSDSENKQLSLTSIKNNTLDSKTIILAILEDNSGNGISLNVGDSGFLYSSTLKYSVYDDRRGLPIYSSTTNSGTYFDEGNLDRVVGIDLLDVSTGAEFKSSEGNIVFARFHDGSDFSGSGDGTDVYVKFYTDEGPYTTTSGDPSSIMMVYPYRKILSEMSEHEWLRTDFVSSWEGDSAVVDDISNIWSYTGSSNNEYDPLWEVISGYPIVDSSIKNLKDAIDVINSEIGNHIYTEQNYISNGDSISSALNSFDIAFSELAGNLSDGVGDKYVVIVTDDLPKNTDYQLPVGLTYTPDYTGGKVGSNMDVFLDGQLLSASTGINGFNKDKDYAETSPTHIAFHFDINKYSNITFVIRK